MPDNEKSYFERRAEAELERAQSATAPEAVRVHYQLAEAYLEKIAAGGLTAGIALRVN